MPLSFFENKYETCIVKNTTLKKKKCSITNIPQSAVVIDLDKEGSPLLKKSRCDYLVIVSNGEEKITAFGIELKGGDLDASHAAEQLQSISKFVNSLNCIHDFFPIALFKSTGHKTQLNLIRNKTIKYGGDDKRILLGKCGDSLNQVLPKVKKSKKGTL